MRHPALVPLSHDHHEALLVALRLKKGGPSSPRDTMWPTAPREQAAALLRFAERELLVHFEIEETLLFPLVSSEEGKATVNQLLVEHNQMRNALGRLDSITDEGAVMAALADFGAVLEAHVRTEERILFPMIEQAIEAGEMSIDAEGIVGRRSSYRG